MEKEKRKLIKGRWYGTAESDLLFEDTDLDGVQTAIWQKVTTEIFVTRQSPGEKKKYITFASRDEAKAWIASYSMGTLSLEDLERGGPDKRLCYSVSHFAWSRIMRYRDSKGYRSYTELFTALFEGRDFPGFPGI